MEIYHDKIYLDKICTRNYTNCIKSGNTVDIISYEN